jgi:hypothetical protein
MSPRRNWDSPNPSLASECAPPPRTGRGAHSPAGGGVPIPTTGEKLSILPTLCFFSSYTAKLESGAIVILIHFLLPFLAKEQIKVN